MGGDSDDRRCFVGETQLNFGWRGQLWKRETDQPLLPNQGSCDPLPTYYDVSPGMSYLVSREKFPGISSWAIPNVYKSSTTATHTCSTTI